MAIFDPSKSADLITKALSKTGKPAGSAAPSAAPKPAPKAGPASQAAAKRAIELPEFLQKKIAELQETIMLAKTPDQLRYAQAEYDNLLAQISKDLRIVRNNKGYQAAPNAKTVTYELPDGKIISRPRDADAPAGGIPLNYSIDEIKTVMPPRPVLPQEATRAAQPAPQAAPQAAAPAAPAASPAVQEAVRVARETLPPATGPASVPRTGLPPRPEPPGPWGQRTAPQPGREPSDFDMYGLPAIVGGAGALYYQQNPDAFFNPNPQYTGPGVSPQMDDFRSNNLPEPPYQGPGVSYDSGDFAPSLGGYSGPMEDRLTRAMPSDVPNDLGSPAGNMGYQRNLPPMPAVPGQEQRFRPSAAPVETARQALRQVMQQSPNELTVQKPSPQQQPSALMSFIRGDFSEGADQRIMDAMRRQREESGVDQGRAMGGAAPKKSGKDDVLNKALDIIHAMLTRR